MTRLLATASSPEEVEAAIRSGADIVHIADTVESGLLAGMLRGRIAICASQDSSIVDYVCGKAPASKAVVAIHPASGDTARSVAAIGKARAVMLDTKDRRGLFSVYGAGDVAAFVSECRRRRLEAWIGGRLEPPDVPRLLAHAPDVICMDVPANDEFRALIPREAEQQPSPFEVTGMADGEVEFTDRILVRDLVLEMNIGAYEFEHSKPQRVRFNVEADVRRTQHVPRDMRDVFSYDIIMDIITTLAGEGHVILVEAMAEQVAQRILQYPQILGVCVRVEKLDLGPGAVGVEISRRRRTRSPDIRKLFQTSIDTAAKGEG